jgi:hypothetical protein
MDRACQNTIHFHKEFQLEWMNGFRVLSLGQNRCVQAHGLKMDFWIHIFAAVKKNMSSKHFLGGNVRGEFHDQGDNVKKYYY